MYREDFERELREIDLLRDRAIVMIANTETRDPAHGAAEAVLGYCHALRDAIEEALVA